MDKKTLQVLTLMLIPGTLLIFTLGWDIKSDIIVTSLPFRVGITILAEVIGSISLVLLLLKKYKTIDSLQDTYDEKEISEITDYIEKYLLENDEDIFKRLTRTNIKQWVNQQFS